MTWHRESDVKTGGYWEDSLNCPRCDHGYMHRGNVIIYDRGEDDPAVMVTNVSCGRGWTEKVPNDDSGNPSARREAIAIQFTCEECEQTSELTIAQHKGGECIGWRWET